MWHHIFFIHSSVNGHLGCFHVLAIVSSATINNGIYVSFSILVSSGYMRRRQWHPTPVLLPGKSHGWRSLVGCSPWGRYSRTRLSDFTFTFHFHALEKEMATHSNVLAWRIPGTGSLVGCHLWVAQSRIRLKRLSSSSSSRLPGWC